MIPGKHDTLPGRTYATSRLDGTVLAEGHALLLEGFLEQLQGPGSYAM
jgi:hypothetical protein